MKTRRVPTREELHDLVCVQQIPIYEVAARLGYTPQSARTIIYRYLHRYGLPLPPGYKPRKVPTRDELYDEIVTKRTSVQDLANRLGYANGDTSKIYRYLTRYGIDAPGTEQDVIRRTLTLTDEQRALVVGCLLGDGSVPALHGRGKSYIFQFSHCVKQREYTEWLMAQLAPFCRNPDERLVGGGMINGVAIKRTACIMAQTIAHPDFAEYRSLFYPQGKKVVPDNIGDLLTPLGLAVWYQDDGSLMRWHSRKGAYCFFHTNGFAYAEQEILCGALARYGLVARIRTARQNGQWHLHLDKPSSKRFSELIRPFVVPSMYYKLYDY